MKKKFDVTRFEPLKTSGDVLRGGFSDAYGRPAEAKKHMADTNLNCNNSTSGCCSCLTD